MKRSARMQAEGITPDLPDNPAPYLTTWLMEIGPVVAAGMGVGPIGWRDIAAWQDVTGIELTPWEATLLRRLSGDFAVMSREAESMDCPAPYVAGGDDTRRAAVSRALGNAFKALAMAGSAKR